MRDIRHRTGSSEWRPTRGLRVLASVASATAAVIGVYAYFTLTGESAPSLSVASRGAVSARAVRRDAAAPSPPAVPTIPESTSPASAAVTAPPRASEVIAASSSAARVADGPASAPLASTATPLATLSPAPPPAIEVASLVAPLAPASAPAPAVPPPALAVPALVTPVAPVASVVLSDRERGLVEAMNARRAAAGLLPLEVADTLTATSRTRSTDMLTNNYFAHSSPTGQTWYSLLTASGLTYTAGGENLAKVSGDAAASVITAIEALMTSPTHRANILNTAFRRVGVGASNQGDTLTIFTTIFTDR